MTTVKKNSIDFVNGCIYSTNLIDFQFIKRGKVRDIYEVGDQHLLIVATDRLSAFDVVMAQPIPNKGKILTTISNFWFKKTSKIIKNHISDINVRNLFSSEELYKKINAQISIVAKLAPIKFEAVVRGFLAGTAWLDYLKNDSVSGVKLRKGLQKFERLDEPIFTPSTKAALGEHDENVPYEDMIKSLGYVLAEEIKKTSIMLYKEAFEYSFSKGIILADTKFEFGLDSHGNLILIDEVFTPDSSRFWDKSTYQKGSEPLSFDKQFIRDYLNANSWNRKEEIYFPEKIINQTSERYKLAQEKLIGKS